MTTTTTDDEDDPPTPTTWNGLTATYTNQEREALRRLPHDELLRRHTAKASAHTATVKRTP